MLVIKAVSEYRNKNKKLQMRMQMQECKEREGDEGVGRERQSG